VAVTNFEPVGERARWRVVYDLLAAAEMNGIVSYEDMAEALDVDPAKDRALIRDAMRRAAKEHEVADKRAVVAVPNVGYRVVQPQEHLTLARRHQVRSSRSLVRGHSKAVNVDMSKIEPETRRALERVAGVIQLQMDFNRRAQSKLAAHDDAIKSLTEATERTEAERQEFRERLERLEAAL
jgi:hypothetical protein